MKRIYQINDRYKHKYLEINNNNRVNDSGKKRLNFTENLAEIYKFIPIILPSELNLGTNSKEICGICKRIESSAARCSETKYKGLMLDFRFVKSQNVDALICIYAAIDICILKHKIIVKIPMDSVPNITKKLISDTGFYQITGKKFELTMETGNIPILRSGANIDNKIIDKLKDAIVEISLESQFTTDEKKQEAKKMAYSAITETVINIEEHAYQENMNDNDKLFWMTAAFFGNVLFVIIYDRGLGIPATLRNDRTLIEKMMKFLTFSGSDDAELINTAMQYFRSRTKEDGRGRGSRDIQKLITETKNGKLDIMSGNGRYTVQENNGNISTTKASLEGCIDGTFIRWALPITGTRELLNEKK